jgi:hypothetical protein
MKLAAVRRRALALPETSEAPHHQYGSFRVRGKIFATFAPDQEWLHLFVDEDVREHALALDPGFLEPLRWGGKVVGLRVQLPRADAAVVGRLLEKAWRRKAPKSLATPGPAGPG